MNVLIFNCGSSSQSFKVYQVTDQTSFHPVATGKAHNVATKTQAVPRLDWTVKADTGSEEVDLSTHRRAAEEILKVLASHAISIDAIGHRFVHGGEWFHETTRITAASAANLTKCFHLAPIHNPNSYSVYETCRDLLPGVPQFAVFDTAFHHGLPPEAARYALPLKLAQEHGFRKYGFHGLSYKYVSERAAQLLSKPIGDVKLVMCHLGTGGSSVTAFGNGHSVDTSLGYSPLPGLIMSTRCGDIDAEIVLELCREGHSADEVSDILNNRSGLVGLSGFSSNLEEVLSEGERGNEDCRIAAAAYVNRLKTYLGGYYWTLNGADAIVFTDSLGTQSWKLRERVCGEVDNLGIHLDKLKNRNAPADAESFIEQPDSLTRIIVIPNDEEVVILREVLAAL
jgi:acetate kinase